MTAQGICSYFVLMPEPYWPKTKIFPLSALNETRSLVRVTCRYCNRTHNYRPDDLLQIFGDVDVDSLMRRMRCEAGDHGPLDVKGFVPSGSEAVGLRIRRLVSLKIHRVPVWRED
ncbi:hypothetical protein [Mesorhizobium sp.]|uniref:hypothetical protein n=1 Tax=Mesorhizobium sp. TaxID=1871066 RepID=UPI000FE8CD02|nr:hypothetical protein [Mesorhizobium sp.]RWE34988.1 MAG: hypothetical protein EOS77_08425 [Mesorhizobium sp.]